MKVNRQTVHRWVSGEGDKLTPEMLFSLSDALNVNARWLALGAPNSPVKPRSLDPESEEVVQIKRELTKHNPEAHEQWVSQGRMLVKLLTPRSVSNPSQSRTKA